MRTIVFFSLLTLSLAACGKSLDVLRGITQFIVVGIDISQKSGLDIQIESELLLRKHDIKVVPENTIDSHLTPVIGISIYELALDDKSIQITITLDVLERANLVRKANFSNSSYVVITWDTEKNVYGPPKERKRLTRECLQAVINKFVNELLAANQ